MESTIEKINDITVFTVALESLDAKSAKDFRQEFDSAVEDGSTVVLDLESVEFVDSAGLGSIVASLKRLRGTGGDIRICNVHKPVRALFELVRMHKLVDIFADREEAVAG